MLSPHTPPGTRVVCVVEPNALERGGLPPLALGRTYVVAAMHFGCNLAGGTSVGVELIGVRHIVRPRWWTRRRFRVYGRGLFKPAVLPSCLTDILTSVPAHDRATA